MSTPEPRESIWQRLLHSQDEAATWMRLVLLVGLLAGGAFGGSRMIQALRGPETVPNGPAPESLLAAKPNAGLVIDAAELDFGEAWEQKQLDIPITVQNPTDHEVEIQRWIGPNGFDIEPQPVTVPAKGSAVLHALFDPMFGQKSSEVFKVVEIEFLFNPVIPEEPGIHPGWRLKGRVKRAISVSTALLELSKEPLQRGSEFSTKSVDVMAFESLKSLTAEFDRDALEVEVTGPSLHNWYKVSVRPAESIPAGGHTYSVGLQAELSDGTVVPTYFDVSVYVK